MTRVASTVEIPVYVVVPPRVLLLDVAGPIEVLRKANLEQDAVRFVVTFIGPTLSAGSSIGLGADIVNRGSDARKPSEMRRLCQGVRTDRL